MTRAREMGAMRKRRALAASAAALLAAGASIVALPEPASAHETRVNYDGGYSIVRSDHKTIRVCAPSYTPMTGYYITGWLTQHPVTAIAGACTNDVVAVGIASHRVCSHRLGQCTGWKNT
jgi:hypothetical protein